MISHQYFNDKEIDNIDVLIKISIKFFEHE